MSISYDGLTISVEVAGWIGTVLILLAYGLLVSHRLATTSPTYQWMNLIGAVGLTVNGAWNHAYPSMSLNIIWLGIAIYSLTRVPARQSGPRP